MSSLLTLFAAGAAGCGSKSGGSQVIDTNCIPHTAANSTAISNALNIVFAFSASIAVLIIVISGFRYIVAHGDPNATAQAKNGILYALIGLIVVMAAYSIVTFVVKGVA
jgi:hypothetical protein